jgi:hypothetical protein
MTTLMRMRLDYTPQVMKGGGIAHQNQRKMILKSRIFPR